MTMSFMTLKTTLERMYNIYLQMSISCMQVLHIKVSVVKHLTLCGCHSSDMVTNCDCMWSHKLGSVLCLVLSNLVSSSTVLIPAERRRMQVKYIFMQINPGIKAVSTQSLIWPGFHYTN